MVMPSFARHQLEGQATLGTLEPCCEHSINQGSIFHTVEAATFILKHKERTDDPNSSTYSIVTCQC